MDEGTQLMRAVNEYYFSTYQPTGCLILKKEKLFQYTGLETKLHHTWCGLHLANDDLSLTIEGAQRIGVSAAKNIITISPEEAERYFCGKDLEGHDGGGHVILRTAWRIIGPGLLEAGKVRNMLPMSRRTSRA